MDRRGVMDRRSGKDRRCRDSTLLAPGHQKRTCFRNKSYGHSRQHHRFNARKDSYVVLKSPPDERLGFLSDISTGGLSFEYIPIEESFNKTDEIGIIFSDKNTSIEKLSCKKIYEIELEDEYYTPVKMHRVGIEFEDIETEQLNKLLIIIKDLAKFNLKEGNTGIKKRRLRRF